MTFFLLLSSIFVFGTAGANRFSEQIRDMLGFRPGIFWRTCWMYITPVFLFVCSAGRQQKLIASAFMPSLSVKWIAFDGFNCCSSLDHPDRVHHQLQRTGELPLVVAARGVAGDPVVGDMYPCLRCLPAPHNRRIVVQSMDLWIYFPPNTRMREKEDFVFRRETDLLSFLFPSRCCCCPSSQRVVHACTPQVMPRDTHGNVQV